MGTEEQWAQRNSGHRGTVRNEEQLGNRGTIGTEEHRGTVGNRETLGTEEQ